MTDANKKRFIPSVSNYDHSVTKSFEKRKSGLSSNVPQLGAQPKQSIPPLVVQNMEQQDLISFMKTSKLTAAEVAGSNKILLAPVVRWKYDEGRSLVPPEVVHMLPT